APGDRRARQSRSREGGSDPGEPDRAGRQEVRLTRARPIRPCYSPSPFRIGLSGGDGDRMTQPDGMAPGAAEAPTVPLEGLGDWKRTHNCGELNRGESSRPATLMGWVHRVRDHGGVIFVDLRDRYGLTQVVFRPEIGGKELLERAGLLGNEWVIAVRGEIAPRPAESVNPEIPTGAVEMNVRELK